MSRIKLIDKPDRTETLIEELTRVWEDSVRATHLFLSEDAKAEIKQFVPEALREVAHPVMSVNEQNPQAIGFYEHLGFKVNKRTETDEQGRPYPLLYMEM